jgi:hypothetical protein
MSERERERQKGKRKKRERKKKGFFGTEVRAGLFKST